MSNIEQLEIEGIGQQLATLTDWKKQNNVFTKESYVFKDWMLWDEVESSQDFLHEHGDEAFVYGNTEKEAILKYCNKENIKPPFWWET